MLTDTPNPSDYIKKMRKRDEELSKGWGQFVTPLSVVTTGGKQKLNCASAKGLRDYPLISIEAAPPYSVSLHNNEMPPIPELSKNQQVWVSHKPLLIHFDCSTVGSKL